jgi:alkanesulfonate monooxygenase SsuD/methylene tetrahydromethanopterin reductase-like flavin-dependent oxidoreductase (luciferase family)
MTMRFGLAVMNDFPPHVVPADRVAGMREQVQIAAGSGVSSIWVLQHYLGAMPTLQPLPTLAALAQDAGDMALGTNMFILPLRHPVEVAEEFATLDHLSGGRAIAGFGLGYRENEFAAFGVPLESRVGRFEESIAIIRGLWSGKAVSYAGQYYAVDRELISLVPVQTGGIPIWIGAGPHAAGARRAARLGDAWIVPPHVPLEKLAKLFEIYRAERTEMGLPTSELVIRRELVLDEDPQRARAIGMAARGDLSRQYGQYNAPQGGDAYRHLSGDAAAAEVADSSYLFTDPAGAVAALRELEEIGVTDVILRAQWFGLEQEQVLRTLDLFAREVRPHFEAR